MTTDATAFDAGLEPGCLIDVPGVPNLRDLGGWATADGHVVARGLVYRSTELSRAAGTAVADLGLVAVVDLRNSAERAAKPDAPIAPVIVADVMADSSDVTAVDIPALLASPSALVAMSAAHGGGSPAAAMTGTYRSILTLPSAYAAYRTLFQTLADADGPVLFHCTAGKDRTGWAAAVLLLLLGVPRADVEREYLLTNDQLLPTYRSMFDAFAAAGGDTSVLTAILSADLAYLRAGLADLEEMYDDAETYVTKGLGLSNETVARLRTRLLV